MMVYAGLAVLGLAFMVFAFKRLPTFLHIFQQEEYDGPRFVRWLVERWAFDRKASAALLIAGGLGLLTTGFWSELVAPVLAALALLGVAAIERDPTKEAKKALVMTERARRVLRVSLAVVGIVALILVAVQAPVIAWILPAQLIPLALAAATLVLGGFERRNNARFVDEARDKLKKLSPTIIGITGSFGKTSVKHVLGHVLGIDAPTLVTPGSVNTELGITRIVREKLMTRDRYFVCEMGAYGPGSIARLCRLAPPNLAIITAIGYAHYERFKSLDTVARAKFELAEAVLAQSGKVIVAQSVLEHAPARDFVAAHRDNVVIVGEGADADVLVQSVTQTATGVRVEIAAGGETHTLMAPLFGEHHGLNIALVFAAATALGMRPDDIALALGTTPQIAHRSEVKPMGNGATLIDDAYNSNPTGFASSLVLLDLLRSGDGRRIVVTPGMVELGAAHDAEHARIGTLVGAHADILLPVVPDRLGAMVDAFRTANPVGIVLPCANLSAAQAWMADNIRAGDAVLLENDLPDLYEVKLNL